MAFPLHGRRNILSCWKGMLVAVCIEKDISNVMPAFMRFVMRGRCSNFQVGVFPHYNEDSYAIWVNDDIFCMAGAVFAWSWKLLCIFSAR